MLKKASHKNDADVRDVPADNPVGTMERFAQGLRRVLTTPKTAIKKTRVKRRRAG